MNTLTDALENIKSDIGLDNFFTLSDKAALIPQNLFSKLNEKLTGSVREYDPNLKSFALSLHLKSASAYRYVRTCFQNALPHESTIRQWCRKADCLALVIHL